MISLKTLFVAASVATTTAVSAMAQTPAAPPTAHLTQARTSPHDVVTGRINNKHFTIYYGRPFTVKPGTTTVRKIWGSLVPWDKADRLGADEATTLMTEVPIVIDGVTVPVGAYTLYIIASENGTSKLAISKAIGRWGDDIDETHDLARVALKREALDNSVDQLTIAVAPAGQGGVIKIQWEKTQFSVNFTLAPAASTP